MKENNNSGVWEVFVPNIEQGEKYKYAIEIKEGNLKLKYDPYAYYSEHLVEESVARGEYDFTKEI